MRDPTRRTQHQTSEPRHNRREGELKHQASSQELSEPSQVSCRVLEALQPQEQLAPSALPQVLLQPQLQIMQLQFRYECIAQMSALATIQDQHLWMMRQEFDMQHARLQQLHQELLEQMQSPLQHLEQYMLHLQQQLQTDLQHKLELLRLFYHQSRQEAQQHVRSMQHHILFETRQQLQALNDHHEQQGQVHHHAV